jgi:adenine-specific DNA-methyltransferase
MSIDPERYFRTESNFRMESLKIDNPALTSLPEMAYEAGSEILSARSDKEKKEKGQFLTPPKIARYIARQVEPLNDECKVLDPGIGSGVLPCAVIERAVKKGYPRKLTVVGYDIDEEMCFAARDVLNKVQSRAKEAGIEVSFKVAAEDFILKYAPDNEPSLFGEEGEVEHNIRKAYDAIVANPPYFKLRRDDPQAQAVMGVVEGHTNIYTLYMGLCARLLSNNGRASFIVPRSFCSGAYFKSFRQSFLSRAVPEHVHIFNSRREAFDQDSVLQENIIFTFSSRGEDEDFRSLKMSSSKGIDDLPEDPSSDNRIVSSSLFIGQGQSSIYYRLPTNELDENILDLVDKWTGSFEKYGLQVSTGPVVPFRSRSVLTDVDDVKSGEALPLYWMQNIRPGRVEWPTERRNKSQGILINGDSEDLLVPARNYVLIRRFSSKEDRRRLTAAPFLEEDYEYDQVGLENHVNYLYQKNGSLDQEEVVGLAALFNSALVDRYFRILNGNTQVNATDLKSLNLPSRDSIREIGKRIISDSREQEEDIVFSVLRESDSISQSIPKFTETRFSMGKIEEAQDILKTLGMPKKQQNELSALTLLVLAQLSEDDSWNSAEQKSLGISEMMDEMAKRYGRRYAENTRESVRKNVVHQFVQGAIAERNPDNPSLPTNSPNTHYALTDEALNTVRQYNSSDWQDAASDFLENQRALIERYRRKREQELVPLTLPSGEKYKLSPGAHNELQIAVIEEFGPRFAPGAQVLYVGDTANKTLHLDEDGFELLNIPVPDKDKLPDVVLYDPDEDWLYLIEAVTSRGPLSPKRQIEIQDMMLGETTAKPVYVSAFPDFGKFRDFIGDIAWETEVWIADRPSHMIHFNGDKFLGPHED